MFAESLIDPRVYKATVFFFQLWTKNRSYSLVISLSNSPDKKESNNGFEHVGMQKGANLTIVCTILLIGLNSKS